MTSLSVRVARRHRVVTLYAAQLGSRGPSGKSLAAAVASRYISAVGGSLKQQLKKRYELAKSLLGRSGGSLPMRSWLLVVKTFPGWTYKIVRGDNSAWMVTAPNGKEMLVRPQLPSKEHEADFDAWMRKETDVLGQLEKEVESFEEAARAPATPKPSSVDLGIPIADVDFTDPKRNYWRVDFGLRDERGRAVGCTVSFWAPGEYRGDRQPYWALEVQATRNGERFGSSHGHLKGDSREALETLARKSMMASFKRYSKLYGSK